LTISDSFRQGRELVALPGYQKVSGINKIVLDSGFARFPKRFWRTR